MIRISNSNSNPNNKKSWKEEYCKVYNNKLKKKKAVWLLRHRVNNHMLLY